MISLVMFSSLAYTQQRYLIFSNGYRGLDIDHDITTNEVYTMSPSGKYSPSGYWFDYDDTLIARFQPVVPLYIDGHHSISTSSHRTKWKSIRSYFITRFGWVGRRQWPFNDTPNEAGFMKRVENGKICGQNFIREYLKPEMKDTLDMVCHSMGYAYMLGFLSEVKSKVIPGKILILAPEGPGIMGCEWNEFMEVWQYGSNRLEPKADVTCLQDGIAPQGPVKGIEQLAPGKGGRLFIPKGGKKGFIRSHHLSYWQWFYTIKCGDYGYFTR